MQRWRRRTEVANRGQILLGADSIGVIGNMQAFRMSTYWSCIESGPKMF